MRLRPSAPVRRHAARHGATPHRPAGQPALAAVLLLSLVGGTAALAASAPGANDAATVTAAAGTTLVPVPGPSGADSQLSATDDVPAEAALARASRDRAPEPVPAAEPSPPAPPVLPGCEGAPATDYGNGRFPSSALCRLPGTSGHQLRADAARAFVGLAEAFRADTGKKLCLTDSYRSYEAQVRLRWAKRGLAAPAGTSNHGTGIAIDLCGGIESFGTKAHRWMQVNGPRFGWVHPSWAGPRGKRPEPWHWEYRPLHVH